MRPQTNTRTHTPRYTVRTQPAGPRALPAENTRACTPPGDVNKPRTHGAGRGSRDCSHRVTYVHAPPPPPPPPWLPPGPAHRLPASPSGAPRWAEVQGAPTGRPQARPGALTPSAVPVPDAVLPALRQARRSARAGRSCPRSCRGGGPRPLSSPTPLRSGPRFTGYPAPRSAAPEFCYGAGGRRRGPEPRAVVRRASRNYSRTGFLSFIKTQSCTDVIAPAAGRPQSCRPEPRPRPTPK